MQDKSVSRQFLRSVLTGVLGFITIFVFGVTGFRIIEGWDWIESLYMTVIVMSTVGTQEVHPLSEAGRVFTMFLIVFGVSVAAYSGSHVMEFLFQRSIANVLGRKAMNKRIRQMEQHSIICGYGRTGSRVIAELIEHQTPFVVIERDEEKIRHLRTLDVPHIQGDATDEDVLNTANIQTAGSLVAALEVDADNLYLTLTASSVRSDLRIIARIIDPDSIRKFTAAGATWVISPIASGATQIAQLISYPTAIDLAELFTSQQNIAVEVSEIDVEDEEGFIDKTIEELQNESLLKGILVAVRHHNGRTVFNPKTSTKLQMGDALITLQQPEHGLL